MRWAAAVLLASASLVAQGMTAVGCDPDWEWCGYDWDASYSYEAPTYEEPAASTWTSWWDEPADEAPVRYEPSVYEPVAAYEPAYEPAPAYEPVIVYEDAPVYVAPVAIVEPPSFTWIPDPAPAPPTVLPPPVVWSSASLDGVDASIAPAWEAAPAPVAVVRDRDALREQLGLHEVNAVWAGDTVTTQGLVTTYSSHTVAMNAGTAARVVASVGTGEASSYDGLLFNGRMTLSDGRPVKGEVYANYVWNGYDWAFDKYVFFQDDLEIARLSSPPPTTAPANAPPAVAPPSPVTIAAPASVVPRTGDLPSTPESAPSASPAPVPPVQPRPRELRAGIALAPQGEPLGRVEVLRGRRVPLWVRATLDGAPAWVASWRLVAGELEALGPTTGTGDDPLVARWRSVTGPRAAFPVRLRASVDVPAEGLRDVDASIDVVVRSPALVD